MLTGYEPLDPYMTDFPSTSVMPKSRTTTGSRGLGDILGMGGLMGGGSSNPALGLILGTLAGVGAATDKSVQPGAGMQNALMLPFMMQLLRDGRKRDAGSDPAGVYPRYSTDLGRTG